MTHFRMFVESDCLAFLEQCIDLSLPNTLFNRILHFCATFFEYLPSNSVHSHGMEDSLKKVEKYAFLISPILSSFEKYQISPVSYPVEREMPKQIVVFPQLSENIMKTLEYVDFNSSITRVHYALFSILPRHPSQEALAKMIQNNYTFIHSIPIHMKLIHKFFYRSILWFGVYYIKSFQSIDVALWTTWLLMPGDESLFQVITEYTHSLVSFPMTKFYDFLMNYFNVYQERKEKQDLYVLTDSTLTIDFDWFYAPIEGYFVDRTLMIDITLLEQTLQFILTLETTLNVAYLKIPKLVRFTHLCKVFELEGEVFLDSKIEILLSNLFDFYATLNETPERDYYSFFEALILHYIATSFNQETYTKYLSVFWRSKFPFIYRMHMIKEMKKLISNFDVLLEDNAEIERNEELLSLYVDCLSTMEMKSSMVKYMTYHVEQNGLLFKVEN
jgi:hypothetical protein